MHRYLVVCLLVGPMIAVAYFASVDSPPAGLRSRVDFAAAISKLKEGMPEAEVTRLLGRPDDIRTQRDPGGISTVGTKEVWRYGTFDHLGTATLGQVYIDEGGRVQYIFGKGEPRLNDLPEERQLRCLLDVLGQVPSYNAGGHYNPRMVIRAVNALLPLGKEQALAVIDEFLRVTSYWHDDGRDGVFLVLRTLFEVPVDPGYMPLMRVGAPFPAGPKDPKLLPRFPIAIEHDIPLLLVTGYAIGGKAEQPESHVKYFRRQGRLRTRPLVPTTDPFSALDEFAKSNRWLFTSKDGLDDERRGRYLLGNQLLRLLDSVYRTAPDIDGDLLPFVECDAQRAQKILADVSHLRIRWDIKNQKYTFLDGSALPELEPKYYRRELWKPAIPGLDVELILERTCPRYVSIRFEEHFGSGKSSPAALKVYNAKTKGKAVAELGTGVDTGKSPSETIDYRDGATRTSFSSQGQTIELKEGEEITAEIVVGKESRFSPVFKP